MTLGSGQTPLGQAVQVSTPGAKTQYDSGPVSGITSLMYSWSISLSGLGTVKCVKVSLGVVVQVWRPRN